MPVFDKRHNGESDRIYVERLCADVAKILTHYPMDEKEQYFPIMAGLTQHLGKLLPHTPHYRDSGQITFINQLLYRELRRISYDGPHSGARLHEKLNHFLASAGKRPSVFAEAVKEFEDRRLEIIEKIEGLSPKEQEIASLRDKLSSFTDPKEKDAFRKAHFDALLNRSVESVEGAMSKKAIIDSVDSTTKVTRTTPLTRRKQ